MNKPQEIQVAMHKDFFDRCRFAIDQGFYMEAIFMEYAAIEARLEIILGVIGLPCNKQLDQKLRKKVNISHRIACFKSAFLESSIFQSSKLDEKFFEKLENWIVKRNTYIHGLYKNELVYNQRMANIQSAAEEGYNYCQKLYNETKRVRRICKAHPELLGDTFGCRSLRCFVVSSDS